MGDLKAAVKTLAAALALSPGRASTWADLAEYYALQGQQREAVACYALTFHFSQNRDKTRTYLQNKATSIDDPKVQQAAQQALQLSLIKGSNETVAAAPVEDSLDAPLPPTAPTARSLPTATPSVAAAPPIAAPVIPPAVVTPPTAPATTPITSAQTSDTVQIRATGMGISSESALQNAYSNAIQQALGLYVDAETLVQNDQI